MASPDPLRPASGDSERAETPGQPGIDGVPEAVRAALLASVPEALEVVDAGADPWDIGAEDAAPIEAPVAAVRPPALEAALPQAVPAAVLPAGSVHHSNSDARVPAPVRTPPHPGFVGGVDLERLVACQTPMAWFEAVAIAQELYAVLMARGPVDRMIGLEPGAVAITPDGGVELRRDVGAGLPAVGQAARILLALLQDAQAPPVQLRLLALQEASPAPECATLSEFSTRLALYERPGRRATIRAVYERFQSLPRQHVEALVPASASAAPTPAAEGRGGITRTAYVAAAVVLTVMALGTATTWLWQSIQPARPRSADSRGRSAGAGGAAAASVWESATSAMKSAARRLGMKVSESATASPPAQTIVVPPETRTPPPRSPKVRPAAAPVAPAPTPAPAAVSPSPPPAVVADMTIYAAGDADVVPPSPLRSRPAAEPQADPGSDSAPEIELVVSQAGEVELVKLLTPQAGVRSSMMLSAVKTWRFTPATRDGRPVRYRLVMRLTNQ